jgi:hypothetical protein
MEKSDVEVIEIMASAVKTALSAVRSASAEVACVLSDPRRRFDEHSLAELADSFQGARSVATFACPYH